MFKKGLKGFPWELLHFSYFHPEARGARGLLMGWDNNNKNIHLCLMFTNMNKILELKYSVSELPKSVEASVCFFYCVRKIPVIAKTY